MEDIFNQACWLLLAKLGMCQVCLLGSTRDLQVITFTFGWICSMLISLQLGITVLGFATIIFEKAKIVFLIEVDLKSKNFEYLIYLKWQLCRMVLVTNKASAASY